MKLAVLGGNTRSSVVGVLGARPRIALDERELQLRQHALALTCRILVAATWLSVIVLSRIEVHNLLPIPAGGRNSLPETVLFYLGSLSDATHGQDCSLRCRAGAVLADA